MRGGNINMMRTLRAEAFLERVYRACPDVAKNDPERRHHQRGWREFPQAVRFSCHTRLFSQASPFLNHHTINTRSKGIKIPLRSHAESLIEYIPRMERERIPGNTRGIDCRVAAMEYDCFRKTTTPLHAAPSTLRKSFLAADYSK